MKVEKRKSNFPFGLMGAKSYIHREPFGVVGMISPWNFPMYLSLAPLAGILVLVIAMHKTSEFTPITSELLKEICDSALMKQNLLHSWVVLRLAPLSLSLSLIICYLQEAEISVST